ncbi:MAG: RHS repeat-associated core domain-containing protein [Verrucomicrobia bacterium]|nr:RHS repeat-associated core domain-containing protein [Verrucomicrobiota bacterium]
MNVLGTATDTATVSLWSKDNLALYTPTPRQGDYFRGEMLFNNNTGVLWLTITNVAVRSNYTGADIVTNTIGKLFMPKTAEVFGYDADGNLIRDGLWDYTWDAENRLVKQESLSEAPTASKLKLEFQYDSQGRRMQKLVSTNNGSVYVAQYTNRFVYDGWNLLASLNPASSVRQAYLWGLDLSGSLQEAGGVSGLLAITDVSQGSHFCEYDGNGNVTALVKADGAGLTAQYEYGPFGELLRATGLMAKANPFRFSTKYQDDETDLLYSGYRYYDPSTGRWLSRDPIEEKGSGNLYAFVDGRPIDWVDTDGRRPYSYLPDLPFPIPFPLDPFPKPPKPKPPVIVPPSLGDILHKLNPLPDIHDTACNLLESTVRGFLSSTEDIRAWNRFVSGTKSDIELTESEMGSVLGAAAAFQAELKKQAEDCKTKPFYWFNRTTQVGDSIGFPWTYSLGRVSIELTTSCACRTLSWKACIDDKYDFDPTWFLGDRKPLAETRTIMVWIAQHVGQCGWKEFYHKGCKDGFIAN